jgi:hypothetical protein
VPLEPNGADPDALCRALRRILAPRVAGYEVVFVDNDGPPRMQELARRVREAFPEARVIRFQRRVSESTVLAVGARMTRGDILMTLDPYLHVSLEHLPTLLTPLANGTDLVCAWRFPRRDSAFSRLATGVFNAMARGLTKVPVHDLNCRTRVMRRSLLRDVPLYGDLHRFMPVFAAWRGYRWCEVQVPQEPGKREAGAFDVRNYARRALDLLTLVFLTRFMRRPLQFFGLIGMASLAAGMAINLYLTYLKLVLGQGIGHRPLLLLGILLVVVGIQVASIGLLGELLIFTHAREIKDYVVQETLE